MEGEMMLGDSYGTAIHVSEPTKWSLGNFFETNGLQPSRYKLYVIMASENVRSKIIADYNKNRAPSGRDPRLRGKVIQTIICQKIIIIIARLYGHIIMRMFTSDCLVCV